MDHVDQYRFYHDSVSHGGGSATDSDSKGRKTPTPTPRR
eukprot:CAMPEP_0196665898 /NCGR_PEP_ID=MMETSP1086-20130531/62960_1 /TAXON_ID=77921 /ORGANISM="Cyanoptyche  gloeocystis , Strain SAG4.97" /LENGTH=38 /DNA_ID= /DNA_START= /DNA_END= /DNA_ORIENTATION=